jgi:hypothetical protein
MDLFRLDALTNESLKFMESSDRQIFMTLTACLSLQLLESGIVRSQRG